MKQWWESLSEQEHKQVIIAAFVVFVGLFYWLVWSPLATAVVDNQIAVERQVKLNQWAKDAITQIKATGGSKQGGQGSISQIVNRTSRQYNITIGRMSPKDDKLTLVVDEIVFATLMNWIAYLEQKQGVKVHKIDIAQTETAGVVRVSSMVIGKS
jgi:general secretion pathway protein M